MEGDVPKVDSRDCAGGLAEESASFILLRGEQNLADRALLTLALSSFQWTRIVVTGIPELRHPSAVVVQKRLFLVGGQIGEKAGCWAFETGSESSASSAANRLVTYPPLSRDELEGASAEDGKELYSAAACYQPETNKIFVVGGVQNWDLRSGFNQYICELDVGLM